jgi:hypothetical protein
MPNHEEVAVQAVNNHGKTVLRYKSSKIKRFNRNVAISPNNKLLALAPSATADGSRCVGATLLEVCEIIMIHDGTDTTHHHGLQVGRVFSYEDSYITPVITSLAFSPDSTKLATILPGSTHMITVWDTSKSALSSASSSSSLFLPLLHTLGYDTSTMVGRSIHFSANGKHLITGTFPRNSHGGSADGNDVDIWSVEDGALLTTIASRNLEAVDHSMVATGGPHFCFGGGSGKTEVSQE